MITAILIDDEQDALESLAWEINRFIPEIKIVDTFTNPTEAVSAINYLKPDCVFLDIEMPEMDGFQLLSQLKYREFDLIITTAYDNYAIQAFKESAIDYLLKPIDTDDLVKVAQKIKINKDNTTLGSELQKMFAKMYHKGDLDKKIALPLQGKTVFIRVSDVYYCKSDGNYTTVFTKDKKDYLLSKKLKDTELLFDCKTMIRVHQSYLVNSNYITEYVKNEGYYLVLENGKSIPVSRANRTRLQHIIESL